jgi:hypothetical protein
MVVDGVAHLGGQVLGHALAIQRLGAPLLVGHRVKLGVADLAAAVKAGVIDDKRLGLIFADGGVQLILAPGLLRLRPVAVKPQTADLAVVLAKRLYTLSEVFEIGVEVFGIVGMRPVEGRVIENGHDIMLSTGVHKLTDEVAPNCGYRVIIVQSAGVVEREAVVMTGGESDVLASNALCGCCKADRPILFGAEGILEL